MFKGNPSLNNVWASWLYFKLFYGKFKMHESKRFSNTYGHFYDLVLLGTSRRPFDGYRVIKQKSMIRRCLDIQ